MTIDRKHKINNFTRRLAPKIPAHRSSSGVTAPALVHRTLNRKKDHEALGDTTTIQLNAATLWPKSAISCKTVEIHLQSTSHLLYIEQCYSQTKQQRTHVFTFTQLLELYKYKGGKSPMTRFTTRLHYNHVSPLKSVFYQTGVLLHQLVPV